MVQEDESILDEGEKDVQQGRDEIGNQTGGEVDLLGVERVHNGNGTHHDENRADRRETRQLLEDQATYRSTRGGSISSSLR